MKKMISLCVRRPVAVTMVLSSVLLAGIFSATRLSVQELPEFSFPRVAVETSYPGMGAQDVRTALSIPLEDALSPVKGLKRMKSVSRDGLSLITAEFGWGTDAGEAQAAVREAADIAYAALPEGAGKPAVSSADAEEEPAMIVAVASPRGLAFASRLAEYDLRSRLRLIEGTAMVTLSGGEKNEIAVTADVSRAAARGLFPYDIAQLVAQETAEIPAGSAKDGIRELVVSSSGRPESAEELAAMTFASEGGPFTLSDIGTVKMAPAKKKSVFVRADRRGAGESAALEIFRRPGADPARLSREVRRVIAEAQNDFGSDADIAVVFDAAPRITRSLRSLLASAALGCLAVVAVLFIFLRDIKLSLAAAASIPFSASASLAALALAGSSLNGMSLSGIALGIGLVSDTSVVVLDLLSETARRNKTVSSELIADAAASVASSSIGGTVTTAVVFFPVLLLPGPLGALFKDLSLALCASVVAGWAYAQFALPSLFGSFVKFSRGGHGGTEDTEKEKCIYFVRAVREVRGFKIFYGNTLASILKNPLPAFIAVSVACAAGLLLLATRPFSFVAPGEAQEIEAVLQYPPGFTLETIAASAAETASLLAEVPGIDSVYGSAGAEDEDTRKRADADYAKERLVLHCLLAKDAPPEQTLARAEEFFLRHGADAETIVRFPRDKTEKILGLESARVLAVKARSREALSQNLGAALAHLPRGAGKARPLGERPEIRLKPDREAAAFLGASVAAAAASVYAATEGVVAGELEIGGKKTDIAVSGNAKSENTLAVLPVARAENGVVRLGSFVRISRASSPATLLRLDRSDAVYLEIGDAEKKGAKKFNLKKFVSENPGVSLAGQSVFSEYRFSLAVTAALSFILLYLSMAALFESFNLPAVLMLTVPFALAGAGPALLLSGGVADAQAVLGLMTLFGLSVNSGMILYERAAEKIRQGLAPPDAALEAARSCLHPILATSLTTALALVPLALSPFGAGQRSMAASLLGGVCAATAMSLFALPPVFAAFLKKGRV